MTATQTPTKALVTEGVKVMIPAGELITNDTYLGDMPAPAGLTVTVYSTRNAWNDEEASSPRYTRIPGAIVWKDNAGFFRDADITTELMKQNPTLDFTGLI